MTDFNTDVKSKSKNATPTGHQPVTKPKPNGRKATTKESKNMSTITVTPFEARVDLKTLTDAQLLEEYGVFTGEFAEMVTPGQERSERYGKREDAYAKSIRLELWMRCYPSAHRAALAHPSIFTEADAEIAAEAAMAHILDYNHLDGLFASCTAKGTPSTLAAIAAHLATQYNAVREVHIGTIAKAPGTRDDKTAPVADRRIYATDPHEYGFDAARSVSADGLSYDLTAVEDAIDQERFGALTENEQAVNWFLDTVTQGTGVSREEALTWLHTTGLTNQVEEYIDLVAEVGSHEEASRLAEQRRFPVKDIAAIIKKSRPTAERYIKAARSATYADCTLTGTLRAGSTGTRRAEVNAKTLAFALTTSLEAHAAQALTKALVQAVPDIFFADYIAEYMADGTTAADVDPALIAEMRAAAEAVAA